MNKRHIITFVTLFVFILVYHFVTLTISPVVWGDEVFTNSMAVDYAKNKTFFLPADPMVLGGSEILVYGPVFFFLDALVINSIGNGIFQARILTLVFGLLLIAAIAIFSYKKIENKKIWLLMMLAFLLDPFFNAGLNRGRMDNTASFFYFISIAFIFSEQYWRKESWSTYLISGVFFLISVLTTARFYLFGFPFLVIAIIQFINSNNRIKTFLHWFLWGLSVAILYLSWVLVQFKSIDKFIDYYLWIIGLTPEYLGMHLVPVESIPLLIVAGLSLLSSLVIKSFDFRNQINLFVVLVISTFYLFVGDTGPYSVIVVPYVYLLLGILADSTKWKPKWNLPFYGILMTILFNLSVFTLKGTILLIEYPSRNYKLVENFIKENIPENSTVVADEIYYYAVLSAGSQFLMLDSYNRNAEEVEKAYREKYNYEYIVISNRIKGFRGYILPFYTDNSELHKVAELQMPHSKILEWLASIKIFESMGTFGNYHYSSTGYDGIIYKRVKPQQDSTVVH